MKRGRCPSTSGSLYVRGVVGNSFDQLRAQPSATAPKRQPESSIESARLMRYNYAIFLIVFICLTLNRAQADDAASPALTTHHSEWAAMRDGVLLRSEVYLPNNATGPLPVVLIRTPYTSTEGACAKPCEVLAARGYAVVNQDVRGTGQSQGVLTPFFQEQHDGYDAVEWVAKQKWSNGKVGLWGVSYYGATALQAMITRPPHLVTAVVVATASDYHDNWIYVNGAFDLWFAQSWLTMWAHNDSLRRELATLGASASEVSKLADAQRVQSYPQLDDWNRHVPLIDFPVFKNSVPAYYEWLAHPVYDAYWSAIDLESRYDDIEVPVLFIGGWYDIFSIGTIRNFLGVKSHSASALARDQTKLVMYPSCHGDCNPAMDFGVSSDQLIATLDPEWWDYWLKGIDSGVNKQPSVKLFVMVPPEHGNKAGGFWITADQYPLPETNRIKFYLDSRGAAQTRNGTGVLSSTVRAVASPPDHFIYDPANPVPTRGGNTCCYRASVKGLLPPGVFDQSEVELRDDILVYSSAPLKHDLTVIGPITVQFWAASSAMDTDFTAKLVDVRPDGFAANVLDRIVNAGLRNGSKSSLSPIKPGEAYLYRLELGDTALVMKAGHRIRLEISSSNFPHFARNPNTGRPAAIESEFRQAAQTILHDEAHPSFLELPVVRRIKRM
jgi:putative CocE/NonD family hydrolase